MYEQTKEGTENSSELSQILEPCSESESDKESNLRRLATSVFLIGEQFGNTNSRLFENHWSEAQGLQHRPMWNRR